MRAWIVTGLLLAVSAFADEYPRPAGLVNDFDSQLPVWTVQALEEKVRAYERATGNEIAVAIVPSLNGMLVDDYAHGLFHAWGVGKSAQNNGVLFVWAPKERRLRIEVGTRLEGVLTDTAAGLILQRVRDLFRGGRYADGVNAAVDGIIQTLGTGPAAGTPAPEEVERQRLEAARRQQEEDAAHAASERRQRESLFGWTAVLGALGVVLYLFSRRRRAARWREELPRGLAAADQALAEADRKKAQAQAALADLRKEAPQAICQRFDSELGSAPDELGRQRTDLGRLRSLPQATYRELKAAHHALRSWQQRMAMTVSAFEETSATLETFRGRREEAQRMLESLPPKLTLMQAADAPEPPDGVLQAAAVTYSQALKASQEQPANWLLVYDLLADVAACLDHLENPAMRTQYQPARCWYGAIDSPAADALAMMYASWAATSSADPSFDGGPSDSGSSWGDSGGFGGGGDSGGGASSDY